MPLFEEELLVLRRTTKRTRGRHVGVLRPDDLANVPFLLYPRRSNLRQIIDRSFQAIGVIPRVVIHLRILSGECR